MGNFMNKVIEGWDIYWVMVMEMYKFLWSDPRGISLVVVMFVGSTVFSIAIGGIMLRWILKLKLED